MSPNDLIPVRIYDDPMQAHLARCLLENEGIEAFVHDDMIVGLNRIWSYAVGGVKLKVAAYDRKRALDLLDQAEHRPLQDDAGQVRHCPKCRSTHLAWSTGMERNLSGVMQWLMALVFAIYPIQAHHMLQCRNCGHAFAPEATEPGAAPTA